MGCNSPMCSACVRVRDMVMCAETKMPCSGEELLIPNGTALDPPHTAAQPAVPRGRHYTVSIAIPGSVIDNTQTTELATAVAGQIARTAAIFKIDEVVVVDDAVNRQEGTVGAGAAFLARVLQFMETPQYLRRALIPMHPDLRLAGALPPLDAPHHMRATEWAMYREGVVVSSIPGEGSLLNVGLDKDAYVPQALRANVRVTLQMGAQPTEMTLQQPSLGAGKQVLFGQLAKPSSPRETKGTYWGYTTRLASSISQAFKDGPYGMYDLAVGTSERGTVVPGPDSLKLPPYQHLLIAFGGPLGLEECVRQDPALQSEHHDPQPQKLFNLYCNTCPEQGSRTIRTEEALLISLSYLQSAIQKPHMQ
ncbi:hypothetical protein ABBQ38_007806 [Trebouxia sp. C0009 RCD-2024]